MDVNYRMCKLLLLAMVLSSARDSQWRVVESLSLDAMVLKNEIEPFGFEKSVLSERTVSGT
jgi:hypothetical protein